MTFQQKLDRIVEKNNSLLCIGLDPVLEKLPKHLGKHKDPFLQFNKNIIDATNDLVCSYKPNSAFYEAQGEKGIGELKKTCDYIKKKYPEIPIILDAKRGDLIDTNKGYVKFVFDYIGADAVTLQSYLGGEVLKPFLDRKEKASIIMCKNSNPDSGEFQDLLVKGEELYKIVARNFSQKWNYNNNVLLVIGSTYPQQLEEVRKIVGDMTLLIPGIGAQGGNIEASVKMGINKDKKGIIISTSRVILYASSKKDFAQTARKKAIKLRDEINKYR